MKININTTERGRGKNKHYWTIDEDAALLDSLRELYENALWRADSGFKNGYLAQLEIMVERKLPGCELKASPHIESRIKTLKAKYYALSEMLSQKGFGWNDKQMMLICERSLYNDWVKVKLCRSYSVVCKYIVVRKCICRFISYMLYDLFDS